MTTPILDFVREYAARGGVRLHMPGHKGAPLLGFESLDITEITGADSLFEADGIIRKSEENASSLFGAHTFYSTEGSSLSIRAMVYLTALYAKQQGRAPLILAARNAHKAFLSAVALTGADVAWLTADAPSYLSCVPSAASLDALLRGMKELPVALYLTSPDYLGFRADIRALAEVCHRHGLLLLVDNAHGAYLKFLKPSQHPIDLGVDVCCDSAHKTLPAITGAAYLHVSHNAPPLFLEQAKHALALFGSTSPSYLILQSLDVLNRILADDYSSRLADAVMRAKACRVRLARHGYRLIGNEDLKLTVDAKAYGYEGSELAALLSARGIEVEFADRDFVVMMLSTETTQDDLDRLCAAMESIEQRAPITDAPPRFSLPQRILSPREAIFSPNEVISLAKAEGRILALATVGCPPAVPLAVCGERLTREILDAMRYYGIDACVVVRS